METINNNNLYSSKINTRFKIRFNFFVFGILLFTFVFSLLKSFVFPTNLAWLLLLIFSILILLFSNLILLKGFILTRIDIMWFIFIIFFVCNIFIKDIASIESIIDIIVYFLAICFLLLTKVNINNYDYSFKLIKLLAILYALSAIFQFLMTDYYLSNVLPLFSQGEQVNILRLLRENAYSGFTNQTAHLAGYIVNGIGLIFFSNWKNNLKYKVLSVIMLVILLVGLMLTIKRAHFIFMIVAILITAIFSTNNKTIIKKLKNIIIAMFIVILFIIISLMININREESPVANFVHEIESTIVGVLEGDDITTGRSMLYRYSWEMFKENSISGIGWREFYNKTYGLINKDQGSHPHNIYLQLLTELGLIGFLLFIIPVTYVYFKTFRLLRSVIQHNSSRLINWKYGIQFSLYSQTFFLLYGLTGNPLTDYNFLLMYFLACTIGISGLVKIKNDKAQKVVC